ncbi:MAG: chemotaxis protein CheW, partial [Anaerolineae bacterium]|nr:chemotaxis protein CheW [Anaerolineae bacterium]
GVVNLRGRILSVLDLRRLWGLPAADLPDYPVIVVVAAKRLALAVLADDVIGLARFPAGAVAPPHSAGVDVGHVQGVSPDGVVIVDVESLFADRKLIVKEMV